MLEIELKEAKLENQKLRADKRKMAALVDTCQEDFKKFKD